MDSIKETFDSLKAVFKPRLRVRKNHVPPSSNVISKYVHTVRCTSCHALSAYDDNSTVIDECAFCGDSNSKFYRPKYIASWGFDIESRELGWIDSVTGEIADE